MEPISENAKIMFISQHGILGFLKLNKIILYQVITNVPYVNTTIFDSSFMHTCYLAN